MTQNTRQCKNLLLDGQKHTSHEFNDLVGWDWRKAVSDVKKWCKWTEKFNLKSEYFGLNGKRFKRYWIEGLSEQDKLFYRE